MPTRRVLRAAIAAVLAASLSTPDVRAVEARRRSTSFRPPDAWVSRFGITPDDVRETRFLPGGGVAVWGETRPERGRGGHAEFTWTWQHGVAAGIAVDDAGRVDVVGPSADALLRRRRRVAIDDERRVTSGPDRFPEQRSGPLRAPQVEPVVVRVLVLYTFRALLDVGGARSDLVDRLDAAISTADHALAAPEVHTAVQVAAWLPVTADDARRDVGLVAEQAVDGTDAALGGPAQELARAVGAQLVVLVVSRRGGRDHAYTAAAWDGGVPCVALRVDELRSGDLTLAHELGHVFARPHGPSGARGDIMSTGVRHRDRWFADGRAVREGVEQFVR